MTSSSKIKGNSFEREIATYLSDLYGQSFMRAAFSGAMIGGSNFHRKDKLSSNQVKSFKGDIIPPDDWVNFNAEAKSYKDFPFHQLLSSECKQLDTWLSQLLDVAETEDVNILFVKLNRKGKFVCVPTNYLWNVNNYFMYNSAKFGSWIITDFESFFGLNKEKFKTLHSETK